MNDRNPIRNLLVATDFSPAAERALEHAVVIACKHGALIRLVHVTTLFADAPEGSSFFEGAKTEARAARSRELEALAERLRDAGIGVHSASLEGPSAARAIVDEAAAFRADMIVVGTRGLTGWRRLVIGSTARRVVEHAPCPVLVVHEDDRLPAPRRRVIMLATDFSESAGEAATRSAGLLSFGVGDTVVCCHAVHMSPILDSAVAPFNITEFESLIGREAEHQLAKEAEVLRAAGFGCRTEVLHGDPAEVLTGRARDLDVDYLVAGNVGRTGLAHLLLGSTAERLLGRSSCPVLVVPGPAIVEKAHAA